MKICAAQTRSIKGNIQENIEKHREFIDLSVSNGTEMIVFPELSLTGYEPALAKKLATTQEDRRFDVFQKISDTHRVTIGVGMPTKNDSGISISMILFRPNQSRKTYSKKYLHRTEEDFFVSGENFPSLRIDGASIAFAICYETSVSEHTEAAFRSGAEIYAASVAKSRKGVELGERRLSEIAKKYSAPVLMSNSVGQSECFLCAGKTSVWNSDGVPVGQLDDVNEGILIYDTETHEIFEKII